MMLAKLMATLAASIVPAANRSAVISALAPRERAFFMPRRRCLVSGRSGAHQFQHVVHSRLAFGGRVADRIEQRLHTSQILGRQRLDGAAERCPVVCELFGEIDFPRLRLALYGRAG